MEIINYAATLANPGLYTTSFVAGDLVIIARLDESNRMGYTTFLGSASSLFPPAGINLNINKQTASYTLQLSDSTTNPGTLVEMNVGSANNITIPPNIFPIGAQVLVASYGTGQTTILAGAGVTLRSSGGKIKLSAQYSLGTLIQRALNEWYFSGDIA